MIRTAWVWATSPTVSQPAGSAALLVGGGLVIAALATTPGHALILPTLGVIALVGQLDGQRRVARGRPS